MQTVAATLNLTIVNLELFLSHTCLIGLRKKVSMKINTLNILSVETHTQ